MEVNVIRSNYRRVIYLSVSISLIFFLLAGTCFTTLAQKEKILATVDGDKITVEEFAKRAQVYVVLNQVRPIPEYYQFLLSTETGRDSLEKYQEFILERMIEEKLQLQKAKEQGFEVTDEEIEKTIQNIIDSRDNVKDKEQLEKELKDQGTSMEKLKEQLRKEILRTKLKREVVGTIEITMGEIKDFYDNNPNYFRNEEGEVKPFDKIKSNIAQIVKEIKANKAWSDWMKEVKEKADIERNLFEKENGT